MKSLINSSAVKDFILRQVDERRAHLGITRVSSKALQRYQTLLRNAIIADIERHPSKGKTFNPE